MEDILEKTDSLNNNFEKTEGVNYFMREPIITFERPEKIDFKECHVAICPNGGLVAICKKKSFLDISKGSRLNDNILVSIKMQNKNFIFILIGNIKRDG